MSRIRQLGIPLLILALGVGGFYGLRNWREAPKRVPAAIQLALVETRPVSKSVGSFPVEVHGVVLPGRQVQLKAEVAGRIVSKPNGARAGLFVTSGSPLLVIDSRQLQLQLEKLQQDVNQAMLDRQHLSAELDGTQRLISLAESRVNLAGREMKRVLDLEEQNIATTGEKDRAERDVLDSQTNLTRLRNQLEATRLQRSSTIAKVQALQTQVKIAESQLKKASIFAPFDGLVMQDAQEVGNFVTVGDHLLTLQDTSQFDIECRLTSQQLQWLRSSGNALKDSGRDSQNADNNDLAAARNAAKHAFEIPRHPAVVTFKQSANSDDSERVVWNGRLERLSGRGFDPSTHTLSCRVTVDRPLIEGDQPLAAMIAGMFVRVRFDIKPQQELLAIPRAALQPNGEIWVVSNQTLRVIEAQPKHVSSLVVLLDPKKTKLNSNDRVVVSTLPMAFDGMEIRERRLE